MQYHYKPYQKWHLLIHLPSYKNLSEEIENIKWLIGRRITRMDDKQTAQSYPMIGLLFFTHTEFHANFSEISSDNIPINSPQ